MNTGPQLVFATFQSQTKATNLGDMRKQEIVTRKIPVTSSLTTKALSLLLRSFVFKELVKKNINLPEEENDSENINDIVSSDDEYGGIIYNVLVVELQQDLYFN
ncbi:Hypothetical predicted protein [Olea europaea subsp. europaea]|uniref:Uncharacterized protein n=1 Tax=Olea europaea subsp. europaea TaxID=158383 RepID=A0A8S0VLK5_OLEEU|nr:Hypothetical predicted protein [Olea europaea subsp. europaea]